LKVILVGTRRPVWVAASILAFAGISLIAIFAWQIPAACAPVIIYSVIGFKRRAHLHQAPAHRAQPDPDRRQAASLTMAGFCFTSLSLLLSFFDEAIQHEASGPENIILFFCCALFCFVASYLALRGGIRNVFGFLSEALIDNGLWCILIGLLAYFVRSPGMRKPALAMSALLVFYVGCLILRFRHQVRT
jgi:hypothetical protein